MTQIHPQFNRRLVGAVSVLRGGIALELSPCAERLDAQSARLPRKPDRIR